MNTTVSAFAGILERERGLQRSLSVGKITMIGIGGAIGTGLFLGSGFAIRLAGPGVLVSYAIGAAIGLLLMGCLAEMTVTHATSGSFGAYAEHYVSPLAGFLVRWSYWASVVMAVGVDLTAVAIYMNYWFPAYPGWLWVSLFSGGLILANAVAVNVFGTLEYWCALIKVTAIVAFIVLASYILLGSPSSLPIANGFANYTAHGGFLPHGWWGAWEAVVLALFSYFGLEIIAVAAGEARRPEIAIPRAFRSTIFRLILFYLLTLALMLAIMPWSAAGIDESPFVKVMRASRIPAAAGIANFVVLVAALSSMNALLYVSTRMMFSLSRAGQAPRCFGVLNKRGVPLAALLLSSIGIAVAAVLGIVSPERAYILMLSFGSFGALFVWMMIFVTHYYFRRAHRDLHRAPRFRMLGFPFTTLLGAVLMAAVLLTTLISP